MSADRPGFRPDIEGLRGIAILLVVAFHANVAWLAGGYVGVDVFFVISGFLITGILAREVEETGDVDLAAFYARRARRLLPAFLVVLLATLALSLWLYAPIDQPAVASDARAVALHYGNVLFASSAVNYHATATNPFLHTWSLAVEEQFYVVWPLLFMAIGRWYAGKGSLNRQLMVGVSLAGAASFAASLWITNVAQPWAFFGMPTRIWEFALGGLAALALRESDRPINIASAWLQGGGLAAITIGVAMFGSMTPYPGAAALLPALGTVAVLIGGRYAPASRLSRLLATPWLQWFGRVSYAWYLWHWPLVGLGAVIDWKIGVGGRLVWSGVALVLAVLTHRFVEEPARTGKLETIRAEILTAGALLASVAAAFLAFGALTVARHRVASPSQRPFAMARHDRMEHDCWGSLLADATAPCIFGDTTASTTVALLGDSHAEHWLPAVDRIGREKHWKVYAMVKPGCPVSDMTELLSARLKRVYSECTDWRRRMLRRIVAMRPSMVILSSYDHYIARTPDGPNWGGSSEAWYAGLRRTYGLLATAGIRTLVIRGTPIAGFDAPACLSRRAARAPFQLRSCEYARSESLNPRAIAAQDAAARGLRNIAFVDMADRVCPTPVCSVVQRGVIVFRDDDHLTTAFALAQASVLGDRLSTALDGLSRVR
jgi:peptidoglycan/LPS O-acetylase OafA/YrhL